MLSSFVNSLRMAAEFTDTWCMSPQARVDNSEALALCRGFVDQAGAAGDAGDAIGIGHGNGGSFHQKPPANASEHTGQAVANGIHSGGGANGLHAGHANGPPPASASLSR